MEEPAGTIAAQAPGIVRDAIRTYFAERDARVVPFVNRTFSFRGTLGLHRAALGADIVRAPANLLLAGPHAAFKATGLIASRVGLHRTARFVAARHLILHTDVAREIEWRVLTELLELPCRQPRRQSRRDALAEAILADPRVSAAAAPLLATIGTRAGDADFRARLLETMATYTGTRAAAAEITTSLLTLSTGVLALKQLTPGAVSLGSALAAAIAQQSAIASFPLGASLGSMWYGLYPAIPALGLTAGLTGGLLLGASFAAAFAGIVADPVQRRLGLHTRRLRRMLAALEAQMLDPAKPAFAVHDHYVARLMDLFDLLGSAWRLAHP